MPCSCWFILIRENCYLESMYKKTEMIYLHPSHWKLNTPATRLTSWRNTYLYSTVGLLHRSTHKTQLVRTQSVEKIWNSGDGVQGESGAMVIIVACKIWFGVRCKMPKTMASNTRRKPGQWGARRMVFWMKKRGEGRGKEMAALISKRRPSNRLHWFPGLSSTKSFKLHKCLWMRCLPHNTVIYFAPFVWRGAMMYQMFCFKSPSPF